MICNDCKIAGMYNSKRKYVFAENFHKNCIGDCGCQHKTGPGWYIKAGERPRLMQTQSP